MSYTALYRKFRPDNFEDVKGQDHIVTTLKNQIKANRLGHAYLFTGTRGTGKTTVAKILAKVANCENPQDGSPCNQCSSCRTIAAGASMNVIEIDAASNNGVDNIREIVDEVSYSPAEGRFKVYIIDEVHMLSIGAFNALLKTLEEPPSYVIFILATTEVHKIPITILSRCQRYDFKRITIETIADRIRELIQIEQVQIEEKALTYIAKAADGSLRDGLSLLDQCIAFHMGQELTYDKVLDVLGAVDTEVFSRLFRCMLKADALGCIHILEEIVMQGRELTQFIGDFTWYLRNLMLAKATDHIEDVIDASTENLAKLKEEAQMAEMNTIMRYIRIFSEISGQLRFASQKRVLIEMALIKVCRPAMETTEDAILDRIRQLENRIENALIPPSGTQWQGIEVGHNNPMSTPVRKPKPVLDKAIPDDIKLIVSKWPAIVGKTDNPMKMYLKAAKLSLGGDNKLMIVLQDGLQSDYFIKNEKNKEQLEEILSDFAGKQVEVSFQTIRDNREFEDSYVDLSKIIHMTIEEEE